MTTTVKYFVLFNDEKNMVDGYEEALIFVGRLIERLSKDEEFVGKWIEVSEHTTDAIKGFYQTMIGKYEIKDPECLSE